MNRSYPGRVVLDVLEHAQDNPGSDLWRHLATPPRDYADVAALPVTVVLQAFLQWNGLHGWHRLILGIVAAPPLEVAA